MNRRDLIGAAALAGVTASAGCLRLTGSGSGSTAADTESGAAADDSSASTATADANAGDGSDSSSTDGSSGAPGGRVLAYGRDSGEQLWQFAAPDDGKHGHAEALAAADGTVFVGADDDGSGDEQEPLVFALDAESGDRRYVVDDLPAAFIKGVFVHGETLHIALVNGELHARSAGDGAAKTVRSIPFGFGPPAVVDGEMYVPGEEIVALDLDEGTRRWTATMPASAGGRPAATGDAVFVGSEAGHVLALDRATGETRWQARAAAEVRTIAVGQSSVWVGDDTGAIYAYGLADGTELYRDRSEDGNDRALAVAGDLLFVGEPEGRIYRIEGRTEDSVTLTETWSGDRGANHVWAGDDGFYAGQFRTVRQYRAGGPTGLEFGDLSDRHIAQSLAHDGSRAFVGTRATER